MATAGTRVVVIRIITSAPPAPSPAGTAPASTAPSPSGGSGGAKKTKEKEDWKILLMHRAMDFTWNTIKSSAEHFSSKYFVDTENYKAQTAVDNSIRVLDMGKGLFLSAKFGYKAFSKAEGATKATGYIGGAVSAIIYAAGKTIGAFQGYMDEAQQISRNAYGNYFRGERAGCYDGGHGTEN